MPPLPVKLPTAAAPPLPVVTVKFPPAPPVPDVVPPFEPDPVVYLKPPPVNPEVIVEVLAPPAPPTAVSAATALNPAGAAGLETVIPPVQVMSDPGTYTETP